MPALPPVPNVFRYDMHHTASGGEKFANRFFFSFSGGTPGPVTCNNLATDAGNSWETYIIPLLSAAFTFTGVNVTDLSSATGATGAATFSVVGTRGVAAMPIDVCTLINHHIARRYRGGKPRTYLGGPQQPDIIDVGHWTPAFVSLASGNFNSWVTGVKSQTAGSIVIGDHVNVSYYQGFKPFTTPSGRVKNISQVRTPPIPVDVISTSTCNAIPGSQRRRYAR